MPRANRKKKCEMTEVAIKKVPAGFGQVFCQNGGSLVEWGEAQQLPSQQDDLVKFFIGACATYRGTETDCLVLVCLPRKGQEEKRRVMITMEEVKGKWKKLDKRIKTILKQ